MRIAIRRLAGDGLTRLIAAWRAHVAGRRGLASLGGLDARMLKDIGLNTSSISVEALRSAAADRQAQMSRSQAGLLPPSEDAPPASGALENFSRCQSAGSTSPAHSTS